MAATTKKTARKCPAEASRRDIAQEITDTIIAKLEQGGELPWRQPWKQSGHAFPRRFNGERYRGINVLLLGLSAAARGYASPYWMSYRQASELGGQVRKGEKGSLVVKYGTAPDKRAGSEATPESAKAGGGEEGERHFRFLKHYHVFNADQVDGLPGSFHPALDEDLAGGAVAPEPGDPLAAVADAMIAGLGVDYLEQGERACYSPALDRIAMPPLERFVSFECYLATKFHEAGHATEVPKRLGIDYGNKRFGNHAYARGELFAELTASFLGVTGHATEPVRRHPGLRGAALA